MTSVPVLTSPILSAAPGVRHAFFTRAGGVSRGLYAELNLGQGSRDDPAAVTENRRRAAAYFDAAEASLFVAYQVHSAKAVCVERPWDEERPKADAVVTATPGLICGALSADCAPILLADAEGRVVAAAHAGWRGALGGVVEATVSAMASLGARRERIVASIGPCIGPQSYEVGLDFLEAFMREAPGSQALFQPGERSDKRLFDLPGFVLNRLKTSGVGHAEWIGRDTCAEEAAFYSNRRAVQRGEGDYGRLLSAIVLT